MRSITARVRNTAAERDHYLKTERTRRTAATIHHHHHQTPPNPDHPPSKSKRTPDTKVETIRSTANHAEAMRNTRIHIQENSLEVERRMRR